MTPSLHDRADAWVAFALASIAQASVALLVAGCIWLLIRRWASPHLGCWIFLLVIAKAALPDGLLIEVERPSWSAALLPGAFDREAAVFVDAGASDAEGSGHRAMLPKAAGGWSPGTVFMLLWALGVFLGFSRLAWAARRTRRLVRDSELLDPRLHDFQGLCRMAGIRGSVALRVNDRISSPAVTGIFHPTVLLPRGVDEVLSRSQLRWVLLHELSHVARGDLAVSFVQSLLRIILFFNPAVWFADRWACGLRERACDDAALAAGRLAPQRSAEGLLLLCEWISARASAPTPALALSTIDNKNQLRHRIMNLSNDVRPRLQHLGWPGKAALVAIAVALLPSLHPVEILAEDAAALREKLAALEKRLGEMEQGQSAERKLERVRKENQEQARKRASEDKRHYNAEQLTEIETLYQVANKNWRTDEARTSLKQLLAKYDKANRTGCATLYMGQLSEGEERREYLKQAVEKFSDCYYFNGCQVGGFGRYLLAMDYWAADDKAKARELLNQIKKDYRNAIDHRGRLMGDIVDAVEKELGIKSGAA